MRALFAPHHRLSCNRELWHQIVLQLEMRGGHIHESGCFLLGKVSSKGQRHVSGAVFYDDLDPAAYLTGICGRVC